MNAGLRRISIAKALSLRHKTRCGGRDIENISINNSNNGDKLNTARGGRGKARSLSFGIDVAETRNSSTDRSNRTQRLARMHGKASWSAPIGGPVLEPRRPALLYNTNKLSHDFDTKLCLLKSFCSSDLGPFEHVVSLSTSPTDWRFLFSIR